MRGLATAGPGFRLRARRLASGVTTARVATHRCVTGALREEARPAASSTNTFVLGPGSVAVRLLQRPSRTPLGDSDAPVDVHSLVLSLLSEMLTEDLELPADPVAQIADPHWRLNGAQRLAWDPGSTKRELARLEELFEPFDDDLRRLCGVTAGQARSVLELLVSASFGVWLAVVGVDAGKAAPGQVLATLTGRVLDHGPLAVGRGNAQALTVTAVVVADRVHDDTLTSTGSPRSSISS